MKQIQTDVAIIAAGPAGLCAAVAAAEKGAKVAVFEKAAIAGGTSNMGMGPFGVESRMQKELLDDLTKEKAFQAMMDYNHWTVDARLVHDYIWKSGDTINWLQDMGVVFDRPTKMMPAGYATWHVVKPEGGGIPGPRAAGAMNKVLQKRAVELGVEFYFETPVKKILTEDGKAKGILAVGKDGEEYDVSSKAVIVATGGCGTNSEMVKEECGYTIGKDMFTFMVPGIVGDGLKMAWAAGAGKSHMEMERIVSCEIPGDGSYALMPVFMQASTIVVNKQGERVMNEEQSQNFAIMANVIDRQQDRCVFVMLDDSIIKHFQKFEVDYPSMVFRMNPSDHFYDDIERAQKNFPNTAFAADSIEELAEKIGVDPKALVETVEEYNDSCEERYDDLFLKDMKYLRKFRGKRFYAMRFSCGAYGSLGGIRINHRLEVLDENWKKIDGFYAAGSDVADIYHGTYLFLLAGNTMGFAVNSGRIAGENAADFVLAE